MDLGRAGSPLAVPSLMRESDTLHSSADRPSWIPGVSAYCDGWCRRCRVSDRCRVFHIRRMNELVDSVGPVSEAALHELAAGVDREDAEDAGLEPPNPEFLAMLEEANRPLSPGDEAAFERGSAARDAWTKAHPACEAAREYGPAAAQIAVAWQDLPGIADDPASAAALESILHFAYLIPVKVARALHGLYDRRQGEDVDIAMADADGTAKLVRLGIAESRLGWMALMRTDAMGTELPRDMVQRLDSLDTQMAALFPDAMAFHREGLDAKGL